MECKAKCASDSFRERFLLQLDLGGIASNGMQPNLANAPVCVNGVTVIPGDSIFAHESTAVVTRAASAEMVLKKRRDVMETMDRAKEFLI